LLPNPNFGDAEGLRATLITKRAIDGSLYTFVKKRHQAKTYLWDFQVTRNKALEVLEFYKAYNSVEVIAYWNDRTFRGFFKNNPWEESTLGSAHGSPGGEYVKITIELEEK